MYVGSLYRIPSRADIERKIPLGATTSIIYIEDEGKFYERNIYGLMAEYNIGRKEPEVANTALEGRVHDLEVMLKQLTTILGGGKIDEV